MTTEEEFYYGEDIQGNKYCSFTDKSPNDFWIQTIIKKDKFGKYTVYSCDIISKAKENDSEIYIPNSNNPQRICRTSKLRLFYLVLI